MMKMTRSEIPQSRVSSLTDARLKAFKDLKGRNPNSSERNTMKNEIVKLAKRANQDGNL